MFDRIWRFVAQRFTSEPRYVESSRVATPQRTSAGLQVTADNAIQIPAVWACTNYIQQSIGMLPWHVMRKTSDGNETASAHPADYLLWKRPSPEWSSFQFREAMLHWAMLWGNGYAEIERDQFGRPFALWPLPPWRVHVCRDPDTKELFYEVDSDGGPKIELAAADVFHLRGFGHGPVGVNVAGYAAQTFGWARAAQLFGATFFGNGMSVSGVVTNKTKLTEEGLKLQKAQFEQAHRGPYRANKTFFLDNDARWEPTSIDPSKAQMVEVHHFLIDEICRIFGVPPHIVAELTRSTNNNIEHQSIEAVQRCLTPWVKRLEDEADNKLFGPARDRGFFTKINMLGLLRGDFKSQAEGFQIYRAMGVVNANEIRDRLDMNKMPSGKGGDKYTMNSAATTLEQIGELPVGGTPGAAVAPAPAAPEPDPTPEPAKPTDRVELTASDLEAITNIKINELVRV